ncbi:MAG: hypothetical protein IT181_22590 [Acidobacteria bacterium]|nr:hypothetical protein [Acidobacteriota bacterium]
MPVTRFRLALAAAALAVAAHVHGQVIPADRLPPPGTWESAGVEGGIPARTTICATVTQAPYNADPTGAASAVTAIQRAIDACPDGQVVYVPAGRYRLDGTLTLINTSITLRGAGRATVFAVSANRAIRLGGLGPWPPPKVNAPYVHAINGGATRGSTTLNVASSAAIDVGRMVVVSETDEPAIVWTKSGVSARHRASLHMVEQKTATSVTVRPPLPINYANTPQLARMPDLTTMAGVEAITFEGVGGEPGHFIGIESAWNVWVLGCEFRNMPAKTVVVTWAGHVELRKNYVHDQTNGGPNSEGLDLLTDVNWSLVVDNTLVAGGFPQIVIGDGGAGPNYAGGFGNVIAYNYAVDAYYTDPPTAASHGIMAADISTNHSPHSQFNLVEGNVMGKFGSDAYHGSGSHTVLFRNVVTARNRWTNATDRIAIQIDRRNLFYTLVGNVLGRVGAPVTYEYLTTSISNDLDNTTIYRLGFPDGGNQSFFGTFPPTPLPHSDGGPRDLHAGRTTTAYGTTLIEGNWTSASNVQDWSTGAQPLPASHIQAAKPAWFGRRAWPPVNPASPVPNHPTIIPAGYRYVHGTDPPGAPAGPPPLAVTLPKTSYTAAETLVVTVQVTSGVITTPGDAYVVVQAGGVYLSLQLDGRLVPGIVPLARNVVLPTAAATFSFPLAGVPAGSYAWHAGVTTPGTAALAAPLVTAPFTIGP